MRSDRRPTTVRSGSSSDRLGQETDGADRGLELVGDVGDEVPSHHLGPSLLRAVLDERDGTRDGALFRLPERLGGHDERRGGRAEEVHLPAGDTARQRLGHQLLDRGGDEHLSVARLEHRVGRPVAVDLLAGRVAHHDRPLEVVDGVAEPLDEEELVGGLVLGEATDRGFCLVVAGSVARPAPMAPRSPGIGAGGRSARRSRARRRMRRRAGRRRSRRRSRSGPAGHVTPRRRPSTGPCGG
ncbi:MAG: hypothetical protein V9E94_14560 [Microthrixaceae bacterium]